jgi:hypothetical protein
MKSGMSSVILGPFKSNVTGWHINPPPPPTSSSFPSGQGISVISIRALKTVPGLTALFDVCVPVRVDIFAYVWDLSVNWACVCIYKSVCVCVWACVCIWIFAWIFVYKCICMYVLARTQVCPCATCACVLVCALSEGWVVGVDVVNVLLGRPPVLTG